MEFYSLVEKQSEKLLADIIEFENGEICGYFYHNCKGLMQFINFEDLSDFIKYNRYLSCFETELIKEGVKEDEENFSDSKDILYSV